MKNYVNYLRRIKLEYKQCKRCVMDTTAQDIIFDDDGNCNYCNDFIEKLKKPTFKIDLSLEKLVSQIKNDGKNKQYDCIVGVSGGVDSSYTLVKVKELGLRPLAVHMDNGWNSELATNNIHNLIDKLGVDLYTHVIDWSEYKGLMQAFFDADVIDIELLYDNAMLSVNYKMASKYGIKYILSGSNTSTEGMYIPRNWNWFKKDKHNIKKIASTKNIKLKTFPSFGTLDFVYQEFVKKTKWIPFLDYLPYYDKNETLELLEREFLYKPYPYKHYESVFTRFYQGYLLPNKFNVDKRKVHFSTLIISNQMSRDEAVKQLNEIPYLSEQELNNDIEYFLKKMKWSQKDLDDYLGRSEKSHLIYGSEKWLWDFLKKIHNNIKK
ncbi:N-acetyl sugar amidotransferase [Aliarcobacter cryaerophilus]|uniref:N-acetyl sugar amidotransferase n=1 Tax=Aliarcobacter cryaerophilus TaxID=28198 RepID=UPI00112F6375|nr:N-acetyl sugar amidotransferase [Aliarcobacter cryaerophilus]